MRLTPASEFSGLSVDFLRVLIRRGTLKAHRPHGARVLLLDSAELEAYVRGEPHRDQAEQQPAEGA